MRGLGSIPTGGNIFHRIFLFSCSKASAANIGIISILVHFEKNSSTSEIYYCSFDDDKAETLPVIWNQSLLFVRILMIKT